MSLLLFEGPAGSGKTTRLVKVVGEHLMQHPLLDGQMVLGLTRYHGSRRRMQTTLDRIPRVGRTQCQTVDSFAWQLVRRWRSLALCLGIAATDQDYQATVDAASTLVKQPHVAAWVAASFPVVVLDEAQDCAGPWLELMRNLEGSVALFAAADAFQDLSGAATCEVMEWADSRGATVSLSGNHRTNVSGLLQAAQALRNGASMPTDNPPGFSIQTAPRYPMAGGATSWKIKSWQRLGPIAILSPTGPARAAFSRNLVEWVSTSKARTKRSDATAGPHSIVWESQDADHVEDLAKRIGFRRRKSIVCKEMAATLFAMGEHDLAEWVHHQRSVRGLEALSKTEFEAAIEDCVRKRRAFGTSDTWKRRAMTIHQAKNREFESVIVLWPLAVAPDHEKQRRMLYNAITRAKGRALILVEDPKRDRLKKPPFV